MTGRDVDPNAVARRWGGLLCIGASIVLGLIDAFSVDYVLDPISFGLLLGTGCVLLGVDPVISRLNR